MPKKSAILNNVTEYSPEDLASYIQQGIVTFEELRNNTEGEFTAKMQLDVEKLLAGNEEEDFRHAVRAEKRRNRKFVSLHGYPKRNYQTF